MIGAWRQLLSRARGGPSQEPLQPGAQKVLFVCMGNLCRSPTAEGVMRGLLQQAGLERHVLLDSAGTHGFHASEPPDPRACLHATARGYALGSLRARPVGVADFDAFDWIFAMDDENLEWLLAKAPVGCRARMALLLAHADPGAETRCVPDPYYGPAAGFERVLDLIEPACRSLVERVQRQGNFEAPG